MPAQIASLDLAPVPEDDFAGASLHGDVFAILNQRPGRRGGAGGQSSEATYGRRQAATPRHSRESEPYDGPSNPRSR